MTAEHEALLQIFLAEEAARGRRPRGVAGLRHRVPWFIRFLEERGTRVEFATLADARAFQGELASGTTNSGTAYSRRTVASYVDAANAFCAWLASSARALDNPFSSLKRVRTERTIPADLPDERTLDAILDELRTWNDAPDLKAASRRYLAHVVAELQYASGLRIAEAAALTVDDVDLERAYVYVRDGKQGSKRIGFLTDYSVDVLERYIAQGRSALANKQRRQDSLFFMCPERLAHVVNGELAAACARAQARACADGVPVPRITSHSLRHALGYHLLRSGCPLRSIQAILGHERIRNTEIYTRVDVADVKAVFDACHPRGICA